MQNFCTHPLRTVVHHYFVSFLQSVLIKFSHLFLPVHNETYCLRKGSRRSTLGTQMSHARVSKRAGLRYLEILYYLGLVVC